MLTAFILVKSSRHGLTSLGPQLADVEGVAEVYTVTGEWDFVAIVRVREHEDLANVVTQHLTKLDGIEKTQTMVAFQTFSAHDLEAMFGLGLEDKQGSGTSSPSRCAPREPARRCFASPACRSPVSRRSSKPRATTSPMWIAG